MDESDRPLRVMAAARPGAQTSEVAAASEVCAPRVHGLPGVRAKSNSAARLEGLDAPQPPYASGTGYTWAVRLIFLAASFVLP
jgi:hypothetical protein